MKLVGVDTMGIVDTHIPDMTGSHETFCGLDGDDIDPHVMQSPAVAENKVTCNHCISMWKTARKIKPSQIANDSN